MLLVQISLIQHSETNIPTLASFLGDWVGLRDMLNSHVNSHVSKYHHLSGYHHIGRYHSIRHRLKGLGVIFPDNYR
jgi:hypothetical protein